MALVTLLFLVTLVGAPFTSARAAIYPDVLEGEKYVMGTAVTLTTYQFAQVLGFAAGGAVTGFFGTRWSLIIDAATFADQTGYPIDILTSDMDLEADLGIDSIKRVQILAAD